MATDNVDIHIRIKQGIQGPAGAAATLDAGTTTTIAAGEDAAVTNSGTTENAVFDFDIPEGEQGDTGATGAAGTNGTDGNTILYGVVDPTTEGVDGNFYLNTATSFFFGPKAAGVWPAGTSLVPQSVDFARFGKDVAVENINAASPGLAIAWDEQISIMANYTHSTTVNPSRIYVNADGLYEIKANVWIQNTGAARFVPYGQLYKNGARVDGSFSTNYNRGSAYGQFTVLQITHSLEMLAGDYVESWGYRAHADDTGAAVNTYAAGTLSEIFIKRVTNALPVSGTPGLDGDVVTVGAPVVSGNLPSYSGTAGNNIEDSGLPVADLTLTQRGTTSGVYWEEVYAADGVTRISLTMGGQVSGANVQVNIPLSPPTNYSAWAVPNAGLTTANAANRRMINIRDKYSNRIDIDKYTDGGGNSSVSCDWGISWRLGS